MNRLGAAVVGVPIDFPDEDIETVWDLDTYDPQVSLMDMFPSSHSYSDGTKDRYIKSVSALYIRESGATFAYNDSVHVLRCKSAALLERGSRLGALALTSTPHLLIAGDLIY